MKIQSYEKFWKRMNDKATIKKFPLRAVFELTYRCNFNCGHCYLPSNFRKRRKELTTDEVCVVLKSLRDIGCLYIGFTGGDPFMRNDFVDILYYAKKCGFMVIINTNGSLIDSNMIRELVLVQPHRIDITLPAMNSTTFDTITGTTGLRDQVFAVVKNLREKRLNVGVKTCVLQANKKELQSIEDFAGSLYLPHSLDFNVLPCLDGTKKPYYYKARHINHLLRLDDERGGGGSQYNWYTFDRHKFFNCGGGRHSVAITPQGKLKICINVNEPQYSILNSSFENAYEKLKKFAMSIKPDERYQCDTCPLRMYCSWCPALSWLEHRNFSTCSRTCRKLAQVRQKIKKPVQRRCTN
ncbi:MAG: radical SAM protein [Candidatus Omnitrophica bacterium]|nr:radical SAM protein [Candidatus Omnitrophota bacterium]